ncbi:unnamed protein product [Clavelina lepadiformis]|uniref:protein-histidine N-methyltransferase n=1 Tax=Clavelina lepadiformis TaxID=159417 RepID=A0ABP0FYS9_CLALP
MDFKFSFKVNVEDDSGDDKEKESLNSSQPDSLITPPCICYSIKDILDNQNSFDDYIYTIESIKINEVCLYFIQPCFENMSLYENNEQPDKKPEGTKRNCYEEPTKCSRLTQSNVLDTSDLVPNVYEGGLKVWECTIDLVKFLQGLDLDGKIVCDLGCGIGLPGICAAAKNAKHVVFQDFNDFVITKATGMSVILNSWINENVFKKGSNSEGIMDNEEIDVRFKSYIDTIKKEDISKWNKFAFISGDWSTAASAIREKVDVILMAETIYSISSYEKLHDLINNILAKEGVAYVAAKSFYFGVGGGVQLWTDFVKKKNVFRIDSVQIIDAPLKREILKMSWF